MELRVGTVTLRRPTVVTVPCGLGARPEKRITTNRSAIVMRDVRATIIARTVGASLNEMQVAGLFRSRFELHEAPLGHDGCDGAG